jgi:uridine monophosphate synthetase
MQCTNGIYRITDWADVISVHAIAGQGTLDAIKQIPENKRPACLLIVQMSSKGTLAYGNYTDATVRLAEQYPELVIGFVCQEQTS